MEEKAAARYERISPEQLEKARTLTAREEGFLETVRALSFIWGNANMDAIVLIAARRAEMFSSTSFAKDVEYFAQRAIASYLRGHAEEAIDQAQRAALFWAANHIESGDYMAPEEPGLPRSAVFVTLAQEAPPEKEEQ